MNANAATDYPGLELIIAQRLICVAIVDNVEHAVPLAGALQAGGMDVIEITLRTGAAVEAIRRIRKELPKMCVGAGTVLTAHQVALAADAGAQFLVAPGLDEGLLKAAAARNLPFIPGVVTPTEIMRAMQFPCKVLKFFPAEPSGGTPMLKVLAGPFAHTGVKFIPTGGINLANMASYLALPQVMAVGGRWMAEEEAVAQEAWGKITALAAETLKVAAAAGARAK